MNSKQAIIVTYDNRTTAIMRLITCLFVATFPPPLFLLLFFFGKKEKKERKKGIVYL